ncbi:MAG: substrate-binding domain-containing protein [Anaerolineae bacterium]|nr:substrate-binding domain-containing protein [Anaerolineae bacterium]
MAPKKAKREQKPSEPLTIGLLLAHARDTYENALMMDMSSVAGKLGARLICYIGGELYRELPENVAFDLISSDRIDGLIISPSLGHNFAKERMRAFCQRYASIPIVSGALGLEEIPQVLPDSFGGMRQLVDHMIEVHGYRRLAFIQGPEGQYEALDRYRAYVESLEAHDIVFDPALVFPGDFTSATARRATQALLASGVSFDAIVAVNDDSAVGALQVLQANHLRVPEDVALSGFDDVIASRNRSTPFTTVRQLFSESAECMVDLILKRIHGEEVPPVVVMPTELVVRRSCGCVSDSIRHATAEIPSLLTASAEPVVPAPDKVPPVLWRAFLDDLTGVKPDSYLDVLDQLVREVYDVHGDVAAWHDTLTELRRYALPYLAIQQVRDPEHFDARLTLRAENLFQQGRMLVSEAVQRLASLLHYTDNRSLVDFQFLDQIMATLLDLSELPRAIDMYLPALGIRYCYLALFEQAHSLKSARLLLTYTGEAAQYYEDPPLFEASRLLPDEFWTASSHDHGVVIPLVLREQVYGFAYMDLGTPLGMIYERLGNQIGGAIFRAQLTAQQQAGQHEVEQLLTDVQRRAVLLTGAAEISRATTSLTSVSELLTQAVNLMYDRFHLYYAGIFLVDETRQWAVLSAGTGEAGRLMLKHGHKLEVGGASMIGTCIAQRQAHITFDADHDSRIRRNPLLPDTRSEMALPLISRDRVIGAMTIQSTQPHAFSEDDITALQTMADQLANAIENARLFEQMEQSRRELEIASGHYTQETWQQFVQDAGQIGYRTHSLGIQPTAEMHLEAREALRQNAPVVTNLIAETGAPSGSALGVPVRLRNQVLGVLDLRFESENVPPETVALVEQIADRLAISLESARLLQETLSTAEREQRISRVTSQMRENLDVDAVVKIAAEQIREIMDLSSVAIRLSPHSRASDEGDA